MERVAAVWTVIWKTLVTVYCLAAFVLGAVVGLPMAWRFLGRLIGALVEGGNHGAGGGC